MSNSVTVRSKTTGDRQTIWKLNQAAFCGDNEVNLVDGVFVVSSLVAELNEEIVGHILFSQVTIQTENGAVDAISLAPMAVLPEYQRQGVGTKLVKVGRQACREHGHKITVVPGQPDFYPRFGFLSDLAQSLDSPFGGGEAWMAMELESGALEGVAGSIKYSPSFGAFE